MKVRMRKLAAGPAGVLDAGRVYDLPEEQALSLAAARTADLLEAPSRQPEAEAAAIDPGAEQAVSRRRWRRKKGS